MDETTMTIHIDADLFREVRSFCDARMTRLRDFVEEALENEMYHIKQAEAEISEPKKKEKTQPDQFAIDQAFQKGFSSGFRSSLFALSGQLGVSIRERNNLVRKKITAKPVKGPQLGLFD